MSKANHSVRLDALVAYVACIALGACALAWWMVGRGEGAENPWLLVALTAAAAVGERWSVQLTTTTVLSLALLPTAFAAVVLGPLAAGIVGASAMLGDKTLVQRSGLSQGSALRWITYSAAGFISGAASGMAARGLSDASSSEAGSLIIMTLVAIAAAELTDFLFGAVTGVLRGRTLAEHSKKIFPVILTSGLVYAPVVAMFVMAYKLVSPWTLPLFLVPTFALQRVYTLYQRQRALTDELTGTNAQLTALNSRLENANLSFATALVQTLEESDRYTAGHSRAVANYARDIAKQMGLGADEQDRVYLCGLVHDIGKIGLSAAVLNKEGRLTLDERREMERHSEIGERILKKVDAYADVARVVRHHHERLDGEGYPDRLRAAEIPLASRIIAVADAYNAMTSDRPYRKAMDYAIARDRLLQAMGSQFFVEPVVAFLAVLAESSDDYRFARSGEFGSLDKEAVYALISDTAFSADAA